MITIYIIIAVILFAVAFYYMFLHDPVDDWFDAIGVVSEVKFEPEHTESYYNAANPPTPVKRTIDDNWEATITVLISHEKRTLKVDFPSEIKKGKTIPCEYGTSRKGHLKIRVKK